jgi:hypothetical protein
VLEIKAFGNEYAILHKCSYKFEGPLDKVKGVGPYCLINENGVWKIDKILTRKYLGHYLGTHSPLEVQSDTLGLKKIIDARFEQTSWR